MLHILSIGNSFSEDAQRYLHDFSVAEGNEMHSVNLYIGGCNLKNHWENAQQDAILYHFHENGHTIWENDQPRQVCIRQVLASQEWDVITLQQASHDSGEFHTYQPYLDQLASYIRRLAPKARLMIHQTWAYEKDATHPGFSRYKNNQQYMHACLHDAYEKAGQAIQADIIPCGDVIQALRQTPAFDYDQGKPSLCRDGFHMSLDYGRYALAATFYGALTGKKAHAPIIPLDDCNHPDPALLQLICDTAASILKI